jgi:hypothetical protein
MNMNMNNLNKVKRDEIIKRCFENNYVNRMLKHGSQVVIPCHESMWFILFTVL